MISVVQAQVGAGWCSAGAQCMEQRRVVCAACTVSRVLYGMRGMPRAHACHVFPASHVHDGHAQ